MVKVEAGKAAKAVAFALFDQGKRPSNSEVKALGLKPETTYKYFQEWKKQGEVTLRVQKGSEGSPEGSLKEPQKVAGRAPIKVGKITITPENWGMTQYGAILILDTYNKAKRDIDYGGTIGEFLCDICEFYRRILNYTEVSMLE